MQKHAIGRPRNSASWSVGVDVELQQLITAFLKHNIGESVVKAL